LLLYLAHRFDADSGTLGQRFLRQATSMPQSRDPNTYMIGRLNPDSFPPRRSPDVSIPYMLDGD